MPVLRYFVVVGGALLALLFVCNAVLPQAPLPPTLNSVADLPAVRIKSERKWPERVVFDTATPVVAPVNMASDEAKKSDQQVAAVADVQRERARAAFAQVGPLELKKQAAVSAKVIDNVAAKAAAPAIQVAAATPAKMDSRSEAGKPESNKPKRKVAKVHVSRPMIIVAQQPQPHFGFFDSTW